jgi:putative oxidoreductase
METSTLTNEAVLTFVLRVILGILFFFQGYDKVFKVKINGVADYFSEELGIIKMPKFFLVLMAGFTSLAELICGALLVLGLFKTYALYILGIDLILVVGAFSLIKPMWDMQLLFPRLILFAVLLYLPFEWDVLSADYIIGKYF